MDGTNKPRPVTNYKRELAFILFKHVRLIITTTLAVFLAAIAVVLFWPPSYGAYGSLLMKSHRIDRDPSVLENAELRTAPVSDNDTYSELSILTSDEVYGMTLRALEQAGHTDALIALNEEPDKRLRALRDMVTARVVPTTAVIEATVTGNDPIITLLTLQTVFDNYLSLRQHIFSPGSATDELAERVEAVKEDIGRRNRDMAEFLSRTNLTNVDQQISSNLQVRANLETALVALERNIADLRGEIAYFNELLTSRDVQMLATAHLAGNITLTGRADIASYLRQDQTKLVAAEESRTTTLARMAQIDEQNQGLRRNQLTYDTMVQELQVLQRSYQTLLTRYGEAQMAQQPKPDAHNPYVSFVAPPRLLDEVLFPKARMVLPIGLIAGGLLALSLAFVKESLDHSFSRPEDVEQVLGIPVLFSIPNGSIRRVRWKTAAHTPALVTGAMPRLRWLRRTVQLALVVGVLWAVGAIASGDWPHTLINISQQHGDPLVAIPDAGTPPAAEASP